MSENKERAILYLLEHVKNGDAFLVEKTAETFGIAKSTVYNYLSELISQNVIKKGANTCGYELTHETYDFSYDNTRPLNEDLIFKNDILPLLKGVSQPALHCWMYAFCEMMNNAIEHSKATEIKCHVDVNAFDTEVVIFDNGVGIFNNIHGYVLSTTGEDLPKDECANLLLSGKFTTNEKRHSGEGIFFTSKVMDRFEIYSGGIVFSRNNSGEDENLKATESVGTAVKFSLANRTNKTPNDIFKEFTDVDEGFFKTQIPLARLFSSGYPVSRSEARRLCSMISRFKEIVLDFDKIDEIGQAFCHELFVVFIGENENVKFEIVNANENVYGMIKRVQNTK